MQIIVYAAGSWFDDINYKKGGDAGKYGLRAS